MPPNNVSVGLLLTEKEQEVARLREQALTSLESKFLHLQQDYEYNLELLDGRDAELERYDKDFDAMRQELAAKDGLIAELHACLAKAESDTRVETQRCGEVLADADKRSSQLEGELAQAKQAHEQALLRQQEHASQTERQLERELADARGALQKQWRELSASFEDQLRHLELDCNIQLEQAAQQTSLATQQAADREAEASEAHMKERSAADAAAEAAQQLKDLQKQIKALVAELERLQRVKDARINQLEQECSRLQYQAKDMEEEHKGHLTEVVADVAAMKKAMADQRDELDKAAQRAKRQHDEDVSVQKARLATLTGQRSQLQADLTEARTLLKLMSRQSSERLERLAAEKEAELSTALSRLADAHRQHEAELRQSREECWAREQELATGREKLALLKATLEDRRKDVVSYKEQLVASGDRERELQRQLTQAGLQAEALLEGSQAAAAAESEQLVKGLIQQRDTANEALLEAQAALLAKEDELAMLRRDLQEVTTRLQKQSPDSAAQPAAAQQSAAHRAAAEAKGQHSSPMKHDAKDVQRSRKAETAGVAESGLPSPSLPATPHSPVDSPPGGLAELRQSLERGLRGPVSQPTLEILLNEQTELKAALQEAHNQNQRLALTVSAMRSDMELMQHHATSPGPQANPAQPPPASSPPSFPPAHDQSPSSCQMQPQPQQQQADGLYTGHVGQHVFQSGLQQQHEQQQGEEVQLLHQQLQDAKAEAEALAEENERLMEMSNALRSECDRSVGRQQQQHVMPVTSFGAQGSVQQPLPLAPELQPQQVYYQPQQAYPLGPHGMPLGQPSTPHAMQWATQGVPHQGLSQHPQLQQALISAQVEGSHQQAWHDVQQPAAGQLAAPSGQHQNGLALTTDDDALPPEVPNLELADLLHHVRQQLQRIESLAEQISAAQAANSPAPEANLPLNALKHGLNRSARTGVEVKEGVSGVPANADPNRPRFQSASDRSTPSQRARLKALQQRQGPRSRVRNYNQQDDAMPIQAAE
ncbi:Coiled-coil domain-containing protein 57 [Trebouxia sp. C0009 RCD-2024]